MPFLSKVLSDQSDISIHLVGHSYGGWTAMKIAKELELKNRFSIKNLVTIDPISRSECTPKKFTEGLPDVEIKRIIEKMLSGYTLTAEDTPTTNKGCLRAPSDLGDAIAILARTSRWTNFYQENYPFLHSSSIPGPIEKIENLKRDYRDDSHNMFMSDETVGKKIVDLILN